MIGKTRKIRMSKCDIEWSKQGRIREGDCMYCGSTQYLQAHHLVGRSNKATRLMSENCVVLCAKHHTFSSEFSAHLTPEKFKKWFKKLYIIRFKAVTKRALEHWTERQAVEEFKNKLEGK